jgi:hypothetical protein
MLADKESDDGLPSVVAYLNNKYGDFEYAKDARALDTERVFEREFTRLIRKASAGRGPYRVLVAGVNSGIEIPYLENFDVTGVDLSDVALARLVELYPHVHARQANIEKLPFADKSLELYVSMRSIHASNLDVRTALSEGLRVTNGPLIISISNGYNLAGRLRKGMYNYKECRIDPQAPYRHLRDIEEFLKGEGYSVDVREVPSEIIVFAEPGSLAPSEAQSAAGS